MAHLSTSEVTKAHPIGKQLDSFRESFNTICDDLGITSSLDALEQMDNEGLQNLAVALLLALQMLPASLLLHSASGGKNILSDLLRLSSVVNSDDFDPDRIKPLLAAVLKNESDDVIWGKAYIAVTESTPPPRLGSSIQQTPRLRNMSSFANSSEHRKYVDDVLKEELGSMYVGIPRLYEAFFGEIPGLEPIARTVLGKCKEGENPLYNESGWREWPQGAKEKDVLDWLATLIDRLVDFAGDHGTTPTARRRPLAQPNRPLEGSTAERKLDIGFVDDPNASKDSKYHWSQILVPGELKRNPSADTLSKTWLDLGRYAREILAAQDTRRFVLGFTLCGPIMRLWEFDRLGAIASARFDIHQAGLQFVSAVLGFLWMSKEQLGFDSTIITAEGKRYIEIERNGQRERLILDELMKRAPCVAGRATTCWKAHREGDDSRMPLVIKDSWQFPEREEEGELLREATEKGVVNVARYYHHETVRVGDGDDDIHSNVRKGLDVTKATNYRLEASIGPSSTSRSRTSRKGRSSGTVGQKRSSSCTDAPLAPSKRTCSSSPTQAGPRIGLRNRMHRRVIVHDYGKVIFKASSPAALLAALEGCIEGYESLYTKTGMLQRDVSMNNLMTNEEDDNPSWKSFLIDLDLAIKKQREKSSGAHGITGTRAFMGIRALLGEQHSFMDDGESFFWVVFWICIHYNGPNEGRYVPQFDRWNYADTEELARLKLGTVSDEDIFRKTATAHFTDYYKILIPWLNRLRRVVFPGGGAWKKEDGGLFSRMREVLREAQKDPEVSAK